MNKRYLELDSLRGLAALFVLFYHCLRIFPEFDAENPISSNNFLINVLNHTPLRLLWSGHESVILFFILSGFVLSLPYYRNKQHGYKTYLIKRSFRIYIPYFVAMIFAITATLMFSKDGISMYSAWFNKIWTSETSFLNIMNHVLFLGYYNGNQYNTVIWSLIHEMRISIFFPFLMIFILRLNWKTNIAIGLSLSIVAFMFIKFLTPVYNTNFALTMHYTSMFIIGSLLAKHIEFIVSSYKKMSNVKKVISLLFAVLSYTYAGMFSHVDILHQFLIDEYAIAAGSSLFIIVALSSSIFSKFLNLKPVLFLGKISYSLYLYHAIILFSFIYIFNDALPIYIILLCTVICSVIVATIAYYMIEEPSMKIGRMLTSKKQERNKAA